MASVFVLLGVFVLLAYASMNAQLHSYSKAIVYVCKPSYRVADAPSLHRPLATYRPWLLTGGLIEQRRLMIIA